MILKWVLSFVRWLLFKHTQEQTDDDTDETQERPEECEDREWNRIFSQTNPETKQNGIKRKQRNKSPPNKKGARYK